MANAPPSGKKSPITVEVVRVIETRSRVTPGADALKPTYANSLHIQLRISGADIGQATHLGKLKIDPVEDNQGNMLKVLSKINPQGDGFAPLYWPRRTRPSGIEPRDETDFTIRIASASRQSTSLKRLSGEITFRVAEVLQAEIDFKKIPRSRTGTVKSPELAKIGVNVNVSRESQRGGRVEFRMSGIRGSLIDFYLADKKGKRIATPFLLSNVRASITSRKKIPDGAKLVLVVNKPGGKTRLRRIGRDLTIQKDRNSTE